MHARVSNNLTLNWPFQAFACQLWEAQKSRLSAALECDYKSQKPACGHHGQRMLLTLHFTCFFDRQVENRVETIVSSLEEKVVSLRQEQTRSGSQVSELSIRLFGDLSKIRGAVEQRFTRVEADIDRLIEQVHIPFSCLAKFSICCDFFLSLNLLSCFRHQHLLVWEPPRGPLCCEAAWRGAAVIQRITQVQNVPDALLKLPQHLL